MRSYPGATADRDHIPGFSKLAVAQRGRRSVFLGLPILDWGFQSKIQNRKSKIAPQTPDSRRVSPAPTERNACAWKRGRFPIDERALRPHGSSVCGFLPRNRSDDQRAPLPEVRLPGRRPRTGAGDHNLVHGTPGQLGRPEPVGYAASLPWKEILSGRGMASWQLALRMQPHSACGARASIPPELRTQHPLSSGRISRALPSAAQAEHSQDENRSRREISGQAPRATPA
jgi:hypothetical protein